MDEFRRRLRIEYENEYKNEYCKMKSLLFSKPKIYDAGGDTSKSSKQQNHQEVPVPTALLSDK